MRFLGRFIMDFNAPEDLKCFESVYKQGSDYISARDNYFGSNIVRNLTTKDCKVIAVVEYDGELNNIFIFDKPDDEMKIFTNIGCEGNQAFNCDGSTFVQTTIDDVERHFMLENSPWSFKIGDEDYEDEFDDEKNINQILSNIRAYLAKKNIDFSFADEDVLFVRQL